MNNTMERFYKGMIIRTSYGTGPYEIVNIKKGCTCPSFIDTVTFGKDAPLSRPHYHFTCKKVGERGGNFYVNGYDENLNSVWGGDKIIVCSEETLLLTICCVL